MVKHDPEWYKARAIDKKIRRSCAMKRQQRDLEELEALYKQIRDEAKKKDRY